MSAETQTLEDRLSNLEVAATALDGLERRRDSFDAYYVKQCLGVIEDEKKALREEIGENGE